MKNKPGSDLCPEGEWEAEILSAEDRVSQNGNPMLELMLRVFGAEGEEYAVQDWVTATPRMQWKIRHLCESAHVQYERDELPPDDFMGRNVRVKITINEDAKWGKQNRVADYLPRAGNGPTVRALPQTEAALDDADIPF